MLCVGDEVTIMAKEDLKRYEDKFPYVVSPMYEYAGRHATVTATFQHTEQDTVSLDVDNGSFVWGENWMIVETPNIPDVYTEDFDAMLEGEVSQ